MFASENTAIESQIEEVKRIFKKTVEAEIMSLSQKLQDQDSTF